MKRARKEYSNFNVAAFPRARYIGERRKFLSLGARSCRASGTRTTNLTKPSLFFACNPREQSTPPLDACMLRGLRGFPIREPRLSLPALSKRHVDCRRHLGHACAMLYCFCSSNGVKMVRTQCLLRGRPYQPGLSRRPLREYPTKPPIHTTICSL